MSSISWEGAKLIQGFRDLSAELGYVAEEGNEYVVWIKDHTGAFIAPGSYIRGESWGTREEAYEKAAGCATVRMAHMSWLNSLHPRYHIEDQLQKEIKPIHARLDRLEGQIFETNRNINLAFERAYPNTDFDGVFDEGSAGEEN